MSSGPSGEHQEAFERGLRFLVTALALEITHKNGAAIVTAACDAIQCFLTIFEAASDAKVADPDGEIPRLRNQLEALLTPRQGAEEAAHHALEAARLARDQAALLLPKLR
jgi:hypothetical protein